ncbi:MAG: nucleotidyltransferase domain-containing protein [Acidimicrobiales bacterium]
MVSPVPAEEALERVDPERRRWVEQFRDEARSRFGPRIRDLRLFGSVVRGDASEESDVDVLVLVDDLDVAIEREISDLAHFISPWLAPVIIGFDAYHAPISRASGFYEELRRESVRL